MMVTMYGSSQHCFFHSNYDFKFSGNWNIQESLDTNLSCVNWVLDSNLSSGIAVNRSVEVINSDIVLDVVP